MKRVIGSIILGSLLLVLIYASNSTQPPSPSPSPSQSQTGSQQSQQDQPSRDILGAHTAAKTFVERRLRSPSTAEFPWVRAKEVVTYLGDQKYRVESYVDAENGFGSMVRSQYTAVIEDAGDRWKLHRLELR